MDNEVAKGGVQLGAAEPESCASAETSPRSLVLFASYLSITLALLIFTYMTVHRRAPLEISKYPWGARAQERLSRWIEDGYWHDCGLLFSKPEGKNVTTVYVSSTGGFMISAFVVEKLVSVTTGRFSWRALALQSEIISAIVAALAALLSFRLAMRFRLSLLYSWVLGAAVAMVQFTFPDNLNLYWEITAQIFFLLFALVFLLLEEARSRKVETLLIDVLQVSSAILLVYMEYIAGLAFLCGFAAIRVLLCGRFERWRHLLFMTLVPFLAALSIYMVQRVALIHFRPEALAYGSGGMFRSGLDGDAQYYRDHLDIAFARDTARGNFPYNRAMLFQWPALFFSGCVALIAVLIAYAMGRADRFQIVAVGSLIAAYLLYAAGFSQAIVIHPYLYDAMLVLPLIIAAFSVLPALLETTTRNKGVFVMVAIFTAIWLMFFQLRLYALWHPLPPSAAQSAPSHLSMESLPEIQV